MKIQLKYDGKNYYEPTLKFFWNEDLKKFAIGINFNNNRDYNFIIDDLIQKFGNHEIKGTSFYYYTKENVYVFDLEYSFTFIHKKQDFSHCVVLLYEYDKIIQ